MSANYQEIPGQISTWRRAPCRFTSSPSRTHAVSLCLGYASALNRKLWLGR